MKLYSYVVTHDSGFAPNPFHGYCTLANCKPVIRRNAKVGDWIVGNSRKKEGNRLIYAMKVEEILPYASYFKDERFAAKIPDFSRKEVIWKAGDNIYKPLDNEQFLQLQSMHSKRDAKRKPTEEENLETKERDLKGKNVLISKRFHYFGKSALELPQSLEALKVGRGHKNRFPPETIDAFLEFIKDLDNGNNAAPKVHDRPAKWSEDDESWKEKS